MLSGATEGSGTKEPCAEVYFEQGDCVFACEPSRPSSKRVKPPYTHSMEHDHPKEPHEDPERDTTRALAELPEALGYTESEELVELRNELIAAMRAGADTKELATRYRLSAEEVVSALEGDAFTWANIGMLIHIGIMRREGGRHDDYREDLEDALMSARQLDLDDVVLILEAVLEEEIVD